MRAELLPFVTIKRPRHRGHGAGNGASPGRCLLAEVGDARRGPSVSLMSLSVQDDPRDVSRMTRDMCPA